MSDDELKAAVNEALRGVIDPEIGLDVVELGLVYDVEVKDGAVRIELTMTTPACPMGEQIVADAETRVHRVPGVGEVEIRLVWDPPWDPSRMSEKAKDVLGWETRSAR